jgi:hypothetical protein
VGFAANFLALPVRGNADTLGDLTRLAGDGLHSQCASLSSAALLYRGAHISSWRPHPRIIGSGFGPHALNNIVGVTLVIALLSFIPEIRRKYA